MFSLWKNAYCTYVSTCFRLYVVFLMQWNRSWSVQIFLGPPYVSARLRRLPWLHMVPQYQEHWFRSGIPFFFFFCVRSTCKVKMTRRPIQSEVSCRSVYADLHAETVPSIWCSILCILLTFNAFFFFFFNWRRSLNIQNMNLCNPLHRPHCKIGHNRG